MRNIYCLVFLLIEFVIDHIHRRDKASPYFFQLSIKIYHYLLPGHSFILIVYLQSGVQKIVSYSVRKKMLLCVCFPLPVKNCVLVKYCTSLLLKCVFPPHFNIRS